MASEQVKTLSVPLDSYMDSLVEVQVAVVLAECGLQGAVKNIQEWKAQVGGPFGLGLALECTPDTCTGLLNKGPEGEAGMLSERNGMSEADMSSALGQFFAFISGKTQSLPEFNEVLAPRVRTGLITRVARAVAAAYEEVHTALSSPSNGFTDAVKGQLRHTPTDIRLILGLQE
eukprot:scaffold4182_cov384-Prasinococcus_capsulatus_cf.AAC.10